MIVNCSVLFMELFTYSCLENKVISQQEVDSLTTTPPLNMSILYKAVCANLLQENSQHINLCCLCLKTAGENSACVDDEVALNLHGQPFHGVQLSYILKFLLGECYSGVTNIFKFVCIECISSAIAGYKFIHCCKDNVRKLTNVVDNIEECLEELMPHDKMDYKSLYVAIQPCNDSRAMVKRYYDARRHLVPEDTAFKRFTQIIEDQKSSSKKNLSINVMDQSLQTLLCCKTVKDINELLDNPDEPDQFKCKICKEIFAKSTSLRLHFFQVHRNKEFKCDKCKTEQNTQAKVTNLKDSLKTLVLLNEDTLELSVKTKLNEQLEGTTHEDDQYEGYNDTENEEQYSDALKVKPRKIILPDKAIKVEAQYFVKNPNHQGFSCLLCDYTAFNRNTINIHIRFKHLGVKANVCPYCDISCITKSALEIHMRKHTGEKPYKCDICDKNFTTKSGVTIHKLLHSGKRPYKCELCDSAFKTNNSLHRHTNYTHRPATIGCKICGHMFKTKQELVQHEIRHYATQPYQPRKRRSRAEMQPWENNVLINNDSLESNITEKSDIKDCFKDDDHKSYKQMQDDTDAHIQLVSFSEDEPIKIEEHIVKSSIDTGFQCKNCGCKFSTYTRYLVHKDKYKNDSCRRRNLQGRGEFKCDLCSFTAFYKQHVRDHIRFKHLGLKGHICSYCNKNFTSKSALETHLLKHTGEKIYQCEVCAQKFAYKKCLKQHLYLHTGERPFKCKYCSKGYRSRPLLEAHITSIHKPPSLKCEVCGAMFKTMNNLRSHKFRLHQKKYRI